MSVDLFERDDDSLASEINMTPLIDVMLVLLVVFMITLPVMHDAVKLQLPQASSSSEDLRPPHVDVAITADGVLQWNGQPVSDAVLATQLAGAARSTPQPEIRLSADRSVRYERIAKLLAAAKSAGLSRIGFVSDPDVAPE